MHEDNPKAKHDFRKFQNLANYARIELDKSHDEWRVEHQARAVVRRYRQISDLIKKPIKTVDLEQSVEGSSNISNFGYGRAVSLSAKGKVNGTQSNYEISLSKLV